MDSCSPSKPEAFRGPGDWERLPLQRTRKHIPPGEVGKIIDSKVPLKKDMFIFPWRLFSKYCFLHPNTLMFHLFKNLGSKEVLPLEGGISGKNPKLIGPNTAQLIAPHPLLHFPSKIALLPFPSGTKYNHPFRYESPVTVSKVLFWFQSKCPRFEQILPNHPP